MKPTPENLARLVYLGRKLWKALTDEEKGNFYFDVGTFGFVELIADVLHVDLGELSYNEFAALHDKIIYGKKKVRIYNV